MSTQIRQSSIQRKYNDGIDLNNQTVEIDPVQHIRRCTLYKDIDIWSYYKSVYPNVRILGDVLERGQTVSKDGLCLGFVQLENKTEPIQWLSYSMVSEQAHYIGSYLWTEVNLIPTNSKVAIMSVNRPEYVIIKCGCYMYGFIVVGLLPNYDQKQVINSLQRTDTDVLVIDNLERIQSFKKQLLEDDRIKQIIVMDELKSDEHNKIRSFSSIMKKMNKTNIRPQPTINSDNIATFLLTSGTTGDPKIAMLTHDNFMAGMKSTIDREERAHILTNSGRHCSVFPMAHMYEQIVLMLMLLHGVQVICCPTPEKLFEHYAILKPTRIFMVPRVLNKVYDKVMEEVNKSKLKRFLVNQALSKEESSFFSRIIFRKVKQLYGGEPTVVLSTSAKVSRDILHFFRIALDIPIYEIFGQTESTGIGACTHIIDTSYGTVGTPMCAVEIKLIDVPETYYRSENNQGEICIRGPCVFKGYYKDEAKTQETIDKEGWLHTGDIGEWTANGTLRIIDRCKHVFKLNQGKYIAPEYLEEIYMYSPWISQIFVDGYPTEDTVVAIVIPNEEYVRKNFISNTSKTFEDLCKNEDLKELIISDLYRLAKTNKLKYYETMSNIYLHHEPFSPQNGLMTSTLKTRRVAVRQYFQTILKSLYNVNETTKCKVNQSI